MSTVTPIRGITKDEARNRGLKRYFTGKPCRNGHIAERYVSGGCVVCNLNQRHANYRKYPEKYKATNAAWRAANREKCSATALAWQKRNPERRDKASRKYQGIPEPTRALPAVCDLCGRKPNGIGRLHVDHNHVTGMFRGWLCHSCNTGLGHLGDTADSLHRALAYLRKAEQ